MRSRRTTVFAVLSLLMISISCQITEKAAPLITASAPPNPTIPPAIPSTQAVIATPTNPSTAVPSLTTGINSGPFRLVAYVDEVLSGNFKELVSTSDGTLWLISDQGVAKIEGTVIKVYLADYEGTIAGIDAAGRVWVVNEDTSQIAAWNGQAWSTYGNDDGWTPLNANYYQYVHGGEIDLQGWVWFATPQDVRAFDGNKWKVYTPGEMGFELPVQEDIETRFEVSILKSGTVWVAECDWVGPGPSGGSGVRWFEKGIWQGALSAVASGCAIEIAEDSSGYVWAGIDSNLWRYDPALATWIQFTSPKPPIKDMRFGFIESLAVDPSGAVWSVLDLCGGASCYVYSVRYLFRDGQWTQVGTTAQYDYYWGPITASSGTGWFSWEGGIYQFDGASTDLVSPLNSKFGVMDKDERVWFVVSEKGRDMLWVLARPFDASRNK